MNAEKFLERTTDPEIRILASLVFSREGDNDTALKRAQMLQRIWDQGSCFHQGAPWRPPEGLGESETHTDVHLFRHRTGGLALIPAGVD